jgi:hypothetical protein
MTHKDAERFPVGRTVLGGAAAGFTYDGALQDAVAREERLLRPLRLAPWQDGIPKLASPPPNRRREHAEPAWSDPIT